MHNYSINIAVNAGIKKDDSVIWKHWARVTLPDGTKDEDARDKAAIMQSSMGNLYKITLTRWAAPVGTTMHFNEEG